MSRFGFHGHEARVHELHHVAERVDGRHEFFFLALVGEDLHLVRLVEVVVHRVGVVREACL